ncbi:MULTISPECIES: CPBP family intramembrane glutamic endopeptidase [Dyella]|uniref:CPBP family intramembrane metalloprotease n=2 Tax=Dyella TaxID=231454 RepID=A0A4R0YZG3_9GAMM|nr:MULTISPECIES: type II CAAX endopeptidase family protein [Dyella]TBR39971.1 CPBP family intramembrane metalloprotease [Dyella terrae]TCI12448.1 CPBP family intramembrane metalloprotease [Dyella soli]
MEALRIDSAFTSSTPPASPPRLPSIWAALGLIVFYFVLQFAVGAVVGLVMAVTLGVHGGSHVQARIHEALTRPDISAVMVMLTLVISAAITLVLARRLWPSMWQLSAPPGFGFAAPRHTGYFVIAFAAGLALPFIGGLLTQWLAQGHEVSQDIKQLGATASPAIRIPLALLIVTLGPLVEEVLFRGVLLSALSRRTSMWVAGLLSAALFACVHLPDLAFLWYAIPNLLLLGCVLAWLRIQSGSIWPAVLTHGVNNALAVVSWFVMTQGS